MISKPGGRTKGQKNPRRIASRTRTCRSPGLPEFAVIGGSQAFKFLSDSKKESLGSRKTPFGKSQPVHLFRKNEADYLFMSRHGEKGYSTSASFVNYRANVYALKDLGVKQVIAWSGPGAISEHYTIGQFVIIDDVIDETRSRLTTFYERGGLGFIRQNPVFCPHLRRLLEQSLRKLQYDYSAGGTYACTEGPRLETPAEIRKLSLLGANLVGMTLVPEVFLARELELCYAALCYVTNYAEGIRKTNFRPGLLFEGLSTTEELGKVQKSVEKFPVIIETVAKAAQESHKDCSCASLMQRYRDRGDIGGNWREWIQI